MYILGINFSHHGSICLIKDGEIVLFLEEERLSRDKYTFITEDKCKIFDKVKLYTDKVDYVSFFNILNKDCLEYKGFYDFTAFSSIVSKLSENRLYPDKRINLENSNILRAINDITDLNTKFTISNHSHHHSHATQAFYNSGFGEAVCVVVDSSGSKHFSENLYERESIWKFDYNSNHNLYCNYNTDEFSAGIGSTYSQVTSEIGFRGGFEEGKTMGLASYKPNETTDNPKWSYKIAMANDVQSWSQEQVLNLMKRAIEISGSKNICLSGGYGLNCVANYYFRKNLPKDINLYCEPIANDAGQSVGLAKELYYRLANDKTVRPQKSIYYGPVPEY